MGLLNPVVGKQALRNVLGGGEDISSENLLQTLSYPTQVVFDGGIGYYIRPSVDRDGTIMFGISRTGEPYAQKGEVWRSIHMSSKFEKLVDLYALDVRNDVVAYPFTLDDGSILIPVSQRYSEPAEPTYFAIYKYVDGVATRKYIDTSGYGPAYFTQSPSTGYIFTSYWTATNFVIVRSTDEGETWEKVYDDTKEGTRINDIAARGDTVVATLYDGRKLLVSADSGETWNKSDDFGCTLLSVEFLGYELTVTGQDYIFFYEGTSLTASSSYRKVLLPSWEISRVSDPVSIRDLYWIGKYRVADVSLAGEWSVIFASQDNFSTATPIFMGKGDTRRIAGFGNILFHAAEDRATIFRMNLPETLDVKYSCVTTVLEYASLAAATSTVLADCFRIRAGDISRVALTIEETYHAEAAAGGKLHVYSSADGTNWDTEVIETAKTLAFTAGTTKRETFTPGDAAQRTRFLKVIYENLDVAQAITNIKVTATLGGS